MAISSNRHALWRARWRSWGWLCALAAITILGGALRWFRLGHSELWLDEILTAETARRGPAFIYQFTVADAGQQFLTYFFEWPAQLIGTSEFWVRLPSAFFGTLAIPMIAFAGRRLGAGRLAALLAAALLALSAHHLRYSREARGYALLVVLALAAYLSMASAIGKPRAWRWSLLAAATFGGFWTSYFFALFAAALWLHGAAWLALTGRRRGAAWARRRWIGLALAGAVPVLLYLPHALIGVRVLSDYGATHRIPYNTAVLPWLKSVASAWFPAAWGWGIAALLLIAAGAFGPRASRRSGVWIFLPALILIPALGVSLAGNVHFLQERFLIFALPFLLIAAAQGIVWCMRLAARLLSAMAGATIGGVTGWALGLLILSGYAVVNWPAVPALYTLPKQNWRGVCARIFDQARGDDLIVPGVDSTDLCLRHYLPPEAAARVLPESAGSAQNLGKLANGGRRLWIVMPDYSLWEQHGLREWLDRYFELDATYPGSVSTIYLFKGPKAEAG